MPPAILSPLLSLSTVTAIAHRGGSRLRPENTLAAFGHAVALGVDALECDVHLSRDDEVVVIHDATLDRTTDAVGPIGAKTAAELSAIDAGHHFASDRTFPFRGRGIGVPTLAAVLEAFRDLPVVVEIKGESVRVAERALAVVRAAGALDRVIIGGFSAVVLEAVRRLPGPIVTSASSREVQSALRRSYVWLTPRRSGFDLFQVPVRLKGQPILTRALVKSARRAGIPLHAWIVDDRDEMERLIQWGVTGLISDRPDTAVEVARGHKRPGLALQDPVS